MGAIANLFTARIMGGGLLAVLLVAGLFWAGWTRAANQRDALATWQVEVTGATRTASGVDKLALGQVAKQITFMGETITDLNDARKRQNDAIEALEAKGRESAAAQAKALREAQAANSRADEAIGRLRARVPVRCESGDAVLGSGL